MTPRDDRPPGSEPHPGVRVRRLDASDLDRVVAIDARITGRRRDEYFRLKMQQALADTGIAISLAGEIDGLCAGYLLARVYYGEFGRFEKVAVLDTLGVHPDFKGRGVGAALLDQLRTNLLGLGVQHLQTEIGWDSLDLLAFFHHEGFQPAPRFCLDLDLERTRRD
jgi:ribosomal protein S18 acetylase RimI-like enzyme